MSSLDGFGPLGPSMQNPAMQGPSGSGGVRLPRTRVLGDEALGTGDLEGATEGRGGSFGSLLAGALDEVVARKQDVVQKVEDLAAGKPVELHDVMIAMGKSEVSFNLMLEVRNKLVDAWRELGRSVV